MVMLTASASSGGHTRLRRHDTTNRINGAMGLLLIKYATRIIKSPWTEWVISNLVPRCQVILCFITNARSPVTGRTALVGSGIEDTIPTDSMTDDSLML